MTKIKKIDIWDEKENVCLMVSNILDNEMNFFFNIDEFFAALMHTIMKGQYDKPFLEDLMLTGKILKQSKFKILLANKEFWGKLGRPKPKKRRKKND